jgi:hypothetical protein
MMVLVNYNLDHWTLIQHPKVQEHSAKRIEKVIENNQFKFKLRIWKTLLPANNNVSSHRADVHNHVCLESVKMSWIQIQNTTSVTWFSLKFELKPIKRFVKNDL